MSAHRSKFFKRLVKLFALLLLAGGAFAAYSFGIIPGFGPQTSANTPANGKAAALKVDLVKDMPHTISVPEEVRASLGIRKGGKDVVAVAEKPNGKRLMTLSASTMFDPARMYRIRARFTPIDVIKIEKLRQNTEGRTIERELTTGDPVIAGAPLAELYSVDLGAKKNDLLDALVQLKSDKQVLENAEKGLAVVPPVLLITFEKAVEADISTINRALRYLQGWKIPKDEVDEVYKEADEIFKDKSRRELRLNKKYDPDEQDKWGKIILRAPADAIIVERNIHEGETLLDPTTNLIQLANVDKLQVLAYAPEEDVKEIYQVWKQQGYLQWTIRTLGEPDSDGVTALIGEIAYLADPNTHTVPIKGLIPNADKILRATQNVTATIELPAPKDVVELPASAIVDDGKQTVVFVQPDKTKAEYTMKRVVVSHRFKNKVFVKSALTEKEKELTPEEEDGRMMPKQPLELGASVITAGLLELKKELEDRESDKVE